MEFMFNILIPKSICISNVAADMEHQPTEIPVIAGSLKLPYSIWRTANVDDNRTPVVRIKLLLFI